MDDPAGTPEGRTSVEDGSSKRGARANNEKVFDDFSKGSMNDTWLDENDDLTLGWQPPTMPYVKDENTTLLCHFDDSLDGVDGEEPINILDKSCVGLWKFDRVFK